MGWGLGLLGGGALLVLAWAVLAAYGAHRWGDATRALLARLQSQRRMPATPRHDAGGLQALPAPVQRYFRAVLRDGQPLVTAVTIEHSGQFNMGTDTDRWKPFTSRQRVVTLRPGFVWDARVAALPGVPVHVHDAYVGGEGLLHAALLGLVTVARLRGTPQLAQGELMRYLAETAWYPTALLPGQGVRWQAVDDRSARATLADGPTEVTLTMHFDERGFITSTHAEARGRSVGRDTVMTPWEGRWSEHREHDGMVVPMAGEVAWLLPEGRKVYWRGRITSLACEFTR